MTHIEQMAKQCGVKGTSCGRTPLNISQKNYNFSLSQLEALEQEIIKKFVSSLSPEPWKFTRNANHYST